MIAAPGRQLRGRAGAGDDAPVRWSPRPGIAHFQHRPEWATDGVHTCDYVDFDDFAGARVLIVGGRQSAYEWAALLSEHGAARVDVVHRHPQPRFAEVELGLRRPADRAHARAARLVRNLPRGERDAIARRFWEVGRLTLEHWLAPRMQARHVHADEVMARTSTLGDGRVCADRIVFATGYKADLGRVPYLPPLATAAPRRAHAGRRPPGLYLPGFTATQDFGPFFGFVRGAPAAATLVARTSMHCAQELRTYRAGYARALPA